MNTVSKLHTLKCKKYRDICRNSLSPTSIFCFLYLLVSIIQGEWPQTGTLCLGRIIILTYRKCSLSVINGSVSPIIPDNNFLSENCSRELWIVYYSNIWKMGWLYYLWAAKKYKSFFFLWKGFILKMKAPNSLIVNTSLSHKLLF